MMSGSIRRNPKRMIVGNDGGVNLISRTAARPGTPRRCRFRSSTSGGRQPDAVPGRRRDAGSWHRARTESQPDRLIRAGRLARCRRRRGRLCRLRPIDPNIVYAGEYLGIITRYDHRTGEARNVSAWPENPSGHGGEDMRYRFQWTAPIAGSPHDPKVIYHGAQVIFRTTRRRPVAGTAISPDLTRNDKIETEVGGWADHRRQHRRRDYCTVFAIAESPSQKGVIWAGSDDGLVHVTRDGGKNWTNVTGGMPGFPSGPRSASSSLPRSTPHRLCRRRRPPARQPAVPISTRPAISAGRGRGSTARWRRRRISTPSARIPKARTAVSGDGAGVVLSTDDGQTWRSLQLNLPTVSVHDLIVKGDDLVLATHGRSLWVLDNIQPLRDYDAKVASEASVPVRPGGCDPMALRLRCVGNEWRTPQPAARRGD